MEVTRSRTISEEHVMSPNGGCGTLWSIDRMKAGEWRRNLFEDPTLLYHIFI